LAKSLKLFKITYFLRISPIFTRFQKNVTIQRWIMWRFMARGRFGGPWWRVVPLSSWSPRTCPSPTTEA